MYDVIKRFARILENVVERPVGSEIGYDYEFHMILP